MKKSKTNIWTIMLLTLGTCSLLACSFAPPYQRPPMPIPIQYKETKVWQRAKGETLANKQESWWQMYDDQVLNRLQEKLKCGSEVLKINVARYEEARAKAMVARSAYFPTLLGIANANTQQTSRHVAHPHYDRRFADNLVGNELSYEIDLWGRIRNLVKASESLAQASAADLAGVSLLMHAELAEDYFRLRGDEELQRVLDKTVTAFQKNYDLVRQRHKEGLVPVMDVDRAIQQLEHAKTQATEIRLKRAELEHAIAVLIGEIPANFKLPPTTSKMKVVEVMTELPSTLLERRPDIIAAEQRVQAANYEIGVATAAFFPKIDLMSLIGFESKLLANLVSKPSLFWAIGPLNPYFQPLATLVIFDGGRLRGLLNKAKATYFETVALYRQQVLTAFKEVEDSLVALHRLSQEKTSQTLATAAAKRALSQSQKRYFGGVINYLDVIVSENIALATELDLVQIRIRQQLASVQLIKALGGGWTCHGKCVSV